MAPLTEAELRVPPSVRAFVTVSRRHRIEHASATYAVTSGGDGRRLIAWQSTARLWLTVAALLALAGTIVGGWLGSRLGMKGGALLFGLLGAAFGFTLPFGTGFGKPGTPVVSWEIALAHVRALGEVGPGEGGPGFEVESVLGRRRPVFPDVPTAEAFRGALASLVTETAAGPGRPA